MTIPGTCENVKVSQPATELCVWPVRYQTLDAWRGMAAFGVVVHHLGKGHGFNLGHVCVLLFFVISGYCIVASAESCLRHGLGFRQFMWRRIHRIYPPYFFAVCFFVVTRLVKSSLGRGDGLSTSLIAWIQNLTLTQWLTLLMHPQSYAAQNRTLFVAAFWSLNYEEQFYLAIGVLLILCSRLKLPMIWGVVILIVPAVAVNVQFPSTSFGFFIEYWINFGLGVVVYFRLCRTTSRIGRRVIDGLLGAFAVISIFAAHLSLYEFKSQRSVYWEWAISAIFGLALIGLRRWDRFLMQSLFTRLLCQLGLITYSLYLVHQFNLTAAISFAGSLIRLGLPMSAALPVEIVFMLSIAVLFWRFCERPFLNSRPGAGA